MSKKAREIILAELEREQIRLAEHERLLKGYQSIGYTRSNAIDASQMTLDTTGTR